MERPIPSGTGGPQTTRFIIAVALAGLVGANILWLVPSVRDARDSAARLRLEIAGRTSDSALSFLDSNRAALADAADELRFGAERAGQILGLLLKRHPEFNSVTLFDEGFREKKRVSRFEVGAGETLHPRLELTLLGTLIPGKVYAGDVGRSENLDPMITLAAALESPQHHERSFLVAELSLKFLSEVVDRFRFGRSGKVYIVDERGFLITDPDISLVLKRPDLGDRPIVREIIRGKAGVRASRHLNEHGVRVEASGIFVPGLGWAIISEENLTEVNALRNRILLLAAISLSIGAALVAVLAANSRLIAGANVRLRELLAELESVGKMLVRRDLELTRANARLEELDQVKSEFVSIAAHQLRTPLTGIRWSYQTLLDPGGGADELKPEERRLLESGLGATLRMIELINDILDVARIEEGRFGIRLRKQPIMPVVEILVRRYSLLAKQKGISFSLDAPADPPLPEIAFDRERISLVLDNILDNALKYTEPGGKITVRVAHEDSRVRVEVADTGIGIPKEQLHRVFTKFFRAENAIRLHTSGTGLGLYVGKNIIERHGGNLELKSVEGKGSTFSFSLPIAPA